MIEHDEIDVTGWDIAVGMVYTIVVIASLVAVGYAILRLVDWAGDRWL